MLAFARCMRDHGVEVPDPEVSSDGRGIQVKMGGGGGVDPSSPAFQAAQTGCATQVGMPQPGSGPGFALEASPASGSAGAGSGPVTGSAAKP